MKNIVYILIITGIFVSSGGFLYSQKNDNSLAIRYLKLGNTYRQSGEFKIAEEFIAKAKTMLAGSNSFSGKYWSAVADEYSAYILCDKGQKRAATSALLSAIETYDKIIRQPDGSQEAAKKLLKLIDDNGCPCSISGRDIPEPKDVDDEGEYNEDIPQKGENLKNFSNSKSRDYSNYNLTSLPSDLPQSIENLGLPFNKFSALPGGLDRYKKLKFVDLSNNSLKEVSSNVSDLKSVEELNFANNQIKSVSDNICRLKNLRVLDLRGNPLEFKEIKKLIQCLPNTLIYHDLFERVEEDEE